MMKTKPFFLSALSLLLFSDINAQVLNQSANWPNMSWTVGGNYNAAGLLNNPTTSGNFAFSDEILGPGSSNVIFAESPIIDLTNAHNMGEDYIYITGDCVFLSGFDTLTIEYWDADATNWIWLHSFFFNATSAGDYNNCLNPTYFTQTIDISSFTTTQLLGFKYRIHYDDNGFWNIGWCMGSPSVVSSPCSSPANLSASNIFSTTVDLSWVEPGSATTWDVEYGPEHFSVGNGTILNGVTSNSVNVTGLTGGEFYDFYVRSHCSSVNVSPWRGPFNFRTSHSFPYHDDFESLDSHQDWNLSEIFSSNDFSWMLSIFQLSNNSSGPSSPSQGQNFAVTEQFPSTATMATARMESPRIDITGINTAQLLFDYHMYGADIDKLIVQIDNGSGFVNVDSIVGQQQGSSTEPWVTRTVDLSSFTGNIQIAFEGVRNNGTSDKIAIDEVFVVSCPQPASLSILNVTTTSADFSWTEQGSAASWDIEWGPKDFIQGNGTSIMAAMTTNSFTGLTPNTEYDIYVRANCSGASGSSEWAGPLTFSTKCIQFTGPYTEGFENPENVICWDIEDNQGYTWETQAGGTPSNNTGPLGASIPATALDTTYIYAEATGINLGLGSTTLLASTQIDLSGLINPQLTFDYHMFGADMGTLNVQIDDGNGFVTVDAITGQQHFGSSQPWSERIVDLSGYAGTIRIGFQAVRGAGFTSDIAIDDISIDNSTGIDEYESAMDVEVFPNPNDGVFQIDIKSKVNRLSIKVYDLFGRVVFSKDDFQGVINGREKIDLSEQPKGVYLVEIDTNNGGETQRIIIK